MYTWGSWIDNQIHTRPLCYTVMAFASFPSSGFSIYCKVASSRLGYYSILDPLGQRSQYVSIIFLLHNKILECATNWDMLLLKTLRYAIYSESSSLKNGITHLWAVHHTRENIVLRPLMIVRHTVGLTDQENY